jgi:hypothetical protein
VPGLDRNMGTEKEARDHLFVSDSSKISGGSAYSGEVFRQPLGVSGFGCGGERKRGSSPLKGGGAQGFQLGMEEERRRFPSVAKIDCSYYRQ